MASSYYLRNIPLLKIMKIFSHVFFQNLIAFPFALRFSNYLELIFVYDVW